MFVGVGDARVPAFLLREQGITVARSAVWLGFWATVGGAAHRACLISARATSERSICARRVRLRRRGSSALQPTWVGKFVGHAPERE